MKYVFVLLFFLILRLNKPIKLENSECNNYDYGGL